MNRNKLYTLILSACVAGYAWLAYSNHFTRFSDTGTGMCFIKHVSGIPCPSCGSTRSVLAILHGDVIGAFLWNPFGFILLAFLLLVPAWIIFDLFTRKNSFLHFYQQTEIFLKRRKVAWLAIAIVSANWIWNIHKGL